MFRKPLLLLLLVLFIGTSVSMGQVYNLTQGTVNTCTGNLFDSGGGASNYAINQNITQTFCSDTIGSCIQLTFTSFNVENVFDFLRIYDGPNTSSSLVGSFTGSNSPGVVTSTSGCLTLWFTSNATITAPGWSATLSCVTCPTPFPTVCQDSCNGGNPPVNDVCFSAQILSVPSSPNPCPNGLGTPITVSSTNLCATPDNTIGSVIGCLPTGNVPAAAADVWYRFDLNAPKLRVEVNGGIASPVVSLFTGQSCNNLIPRGCATGSSGSLVANFNGLASGTYYLKVSGIDPSDQCDFDLTLRSDFDCSSCVINGSITANPPPVNGFYLPGQTVDFCYSITSFNQTSSNWLHGVIPEFSSGWDMSTFTPVSMSNCSNAGIWNWYGQPITSSATSSVFPPGFYYESALGEPNGFADNNPGNNYGDNNPNNSCDWQFCWRITTKADGNCIPNSPVNVFVNTTGDGESGSWTSLACANDPEAVFQADMECDAAYGFVYNDLNLNCVHDYGEPLIPNMNLLIDPGNIVVNSQVGGAWSLDGLPDGNYTITIDTIQSQWIPHCDTTIAFSVNNGTAGPISFGMSPTAPCTEPEITVSAPFLRRCQNSTVWVSACNDILASSILQNPHVIVTLDPLLTLNSASIPYSSLGGNMFRFNLSHLAPGACTNFSLQTSVSCNTVLNQTLCIEGELFPVEDCVLDTTPGPGNCNLPWDRSSLNVNANCQGDSLACFTIQNTGDPGQGDMQCYSQIRVYYDGILTIVDSVMLPGGTDTTLCYLATGQTIRLEVDQHPLHPGNSRPNDVLELCGNNTFFTPGLLTAQYQDDADPVIDVFCLPVIGSFDPNDKTGFPTGLTSNHYVLPNQQMDYLIRFQNTGNDTAFTVIIRDTLDPHLNIFTVTPGAASHPFRFRMYGSRVMEWRFDYIMLPDSGTDFEGSQGFVRFSVEQNPNLPNGTQFFNEAYIYFDYNDPILTNQTLHTVQMPGAVPIALPVEWLEITAKSEETYIKVIWSTLSETNNRGFEVLRLDDNGQFVRIGWVDGNGNSNQVNGYSFIDHNVDPNITYYYRLRQMDYNGRSELSRVVSAKLEISHFVASARPNPYSKQTELSLLLNEKAMVKIEVFSPLGQLVSSLYEGSLDAGTHRFPFGSETAKMKSNLYTVRITVDGETAFLKLIEVD